MIRALWNAIHRRFVRKTWVDVPHSSEWIVEAVGPTMTRWRLTFKEVCFETGEIRTVPWCHTFGAPWVVYLPHGQRPDR